MGSNVKRTVIWMIVFMFIAVAGIFLYANIRSEGNHSDGEREAAALTDENGAVENGTMQIGAMQIGDDTRPFYRTILFLIRINSPIPLLKR